MVSLVFSLYCIIIAVNYSILLKCIALVVQYNQVLRNAVAVPYHGLRVGFHDYLRESHNHMHVRNLSFCGIRISWYM